MINWLIDEHFRWLYISASVILNRVLMSNRLDSHENSTKFVYCPSRWFWGFLLIGKKKINEYLQPTVRCRRVLLWTRALFILRRSFLGKEFFGLLEYALIILRVNWRMVGLSLPWSGLMHWYDLIILPYYSPGKILSLKYLRFIVSGYDWTALCCIGWWKSSYHWCKKFTESSKGPRPVQAGSVCRLCEKGMKQVITTLF